MTTQTYDKAGNMVLLSNCVGGSVFALSSYTYDKVNNRKTQVETDSMVTTWAYDRDYRLVNEKRAGRPTPGNAKRDTERKTGQVGQVRLFGMIRQESQLSQLSRFLRRAKHQQRAARMREIMVGGNVESRGGAVG